MVHKPLYEQIPVQIWTKFWLIIFQLHFSEQCTVHFSLCLKENYNCDISAGEIIRGFATFTSRIFGRKRKY